MFGYLKNVKWRKGYHKSNPGAREFFHTQPLTIIWILNLKLTVTTQGPAHPRTHWCFQIILCF